MCLSCVHEVLIPEPMKQIGTIEHIGEMVGISPSLTSSLEFEP